MGSRGWLARLVVLAIVASGCGQAPAPPAKALLVASFYPLWEFTRQVAGDRADVVSLAPPGVEPHDWEPSAQDMERLRGARLFVYNGAGLEPWVDKFMRETAGKGPRTVRAAEGLPLITANSGRVASTDPHVWLDPVLAEAMVENIRSALTAVDPVGAAAYSDNARAFTARLRALHEAFEAGLRDCARRDIVVSHAAFRYLARRYRLSEVSVAGLAPESEPSPAQLVAIVRFARERKVKYIFFETLVSPRLAETLAREVGARTLVLNPIEGLTREEAAAAKDYVALMEDNLKHLRIALECR